MNNTDNDRWRRLVWVKGDVEPVSGRERTAEDITVAEKGFEKLFGRKLYPETPSVEHTGSETASRQSFFSSWKRPVFSHLRILT